MSSSLDMEVDVMLGSVLGLDDFFRLRFPEFLPISSSEYFLASASFVKCLVPASPPNGQFPSLAVQTPIEPSTFT